MFSDRYHSRVIRTPRHARSALAYVLNNGRRHREDWQKGRDWVDPCSSAEYFDGWKGVPARGRTHVRVDDDEEVVLPARSWLLVAGWKRHGRIDPREVPGPAEGWGS